MLPCPKQSATSNHPIANRGAWIIIAVLCALTGTRNAAAHDRDELAAFVTHYFIDSGTAMQSAVVDYTCRVQSLRDAQSVNERLAQLKDRPDHPERSVVEMHARLLREPAVSTGQCVFGGRNLWSMRTKFGNVYSYACGGVDNRRWQLSLQDGHSVGQLTVIRSSVDYPSGYDLASLFDDPFMSQVRLLLGYGNAIGATLELESLDLDRHKWNATLGRRGVANSAWNIEGRWLDDAPIVTRVSRPARRGGTSQDILTYFDHAPTPGATWPVPRRVVVDTSDEQRAEYEITSIVREPPHRLRELCGVPEPPKTVAVLDFTESNSDAWALYPDTPRMQWVHAKDADTVRMMPTTIGEDVSSRSGGAEQHSATNSGILRWIAIAGAAVVLGGVVLWKIRGAR